MATSEEKLDLQFLSNSIISVDWAYIDFEWLYRLYQQKVWFVTRTKTSMQYRIVEQHQPIDQPQVTRDDEIEFIIIFLSQQQQMMQEFYDFCASITSVLSRLHSSSLINLLSVPSLPYLTALIFTNPQYSNAYVSSSSSHVE